jgi:hypothetical protein
MREKPKETQAPRIVALFLMATLLAACCSSFSSEDALHDQAARQWLRPWAHEYRWNKLTEWRSVDRSRFALAEGLLRDSAFVQLTQSQVNELLGNSFQANKVGNTAYLLRGVGDARDKFPLELYVSSVGEAGIWVGGGANSRCEVPMERRAVVVWLEKAPGNVYVTFVVAE